MTWANNAKVYLNNVLQTNVIEGVSISLGRQSIDQQSQAGYARVAFLNFDAETVDLNDDIQIKIDNYAGTPTTIFTGDVTDIQTTVLDSGTTITTVTDLICTSALARLAILNVNADGYAEQLEGDRMLSVLDEALALSWDELPATKVWTDYTTEVWTDLRGFDSTEIDTPGLFTLYTQTTDLTNAYEYAALVATSGMGQLYETPGGLIGYADQDHRADYLTANGFIDLSKNFILSDGISITTSKDNITNDAIINYGSTPATSETIDADSVDLYGRNAQSITTLLKNSADADTYADRIVLLNAEPHPVISGIGIQIDTPTMTSTLLNALVGVFFGMPLSITNFPSNLYAHDFFGYVEGWTWTINRFSARLDLNVSDVTFSAKAVAWQDVFAGELWNTLDPELDWAHALLGVN